MKKYKIHILLFLFLVSFLSLSAQDQKMLIKSIKFQDKIWVTANINNIKKALILSNHVLVKMDSLYKTGNFETNVEGSRYDAFRHIYWMYSLAKEIGIDKSRKIGLMYEDYNYYIFNIKPLSGYDLAGRTMDEYNNEVGLYLFSKIGKQETEEVFENIKDLISKGYAKIIARDKNKNSLDKNNKIIPEEQWKKEWKNNRYLINSNVVL